MIDEETAPVVRRIFEMRASGMGFHAIAVALNEEEGFVARCAVRHRAWARFTPPEVNHKWADQTVKNMVRNEVYIGNMVQGKSGTLSYKSRKLVNKSEDEWIRVEGTHEAIISRNCGILVTGIGKGAEKRPVRWLQEHLHRTCVLRRLRFQNAEPHRKIHL